MLLNEMVELNPYFNNKIIDNEAKKYRSINVNIVLIIISYDLHF